jgi:hypothetical protein
VTIDFREVHKKNSGVQIKRVDPTVAIQVAHSHGVGARKKTCLTAGAR